MNRSPRSLPLVPIVLVLALGARGEELGDPETLPEIEVTATRRAGPTFESPRAMTVVGEREIEDRQSRTAPEALREAPAVVVQQTAYGQGSPFIRGRTGNQVLLLVDGVRLNNSTFRFGANQYLATVDPFTIARIEVVRGPGSVLYGSDALGGVVHVITKSRNDFAYTYDLGGELLGRYGSAAKELTGRLAVEGNAGDLGLIGGLTHSDFEDLRGGRSTGVQPNTDYSSYAGDLKLTYALGAHELALAHQHLTEHDVPRSDRLNLALPGRLPVNLRLDFEPQRRDLTYLSYRFADPSAGDLPLAGIRSNVSFHRQEEGRFEIRRARPDVEQRERDRVETWGTSHEIALAEILRQTFTAGVEYYRDHVDSERTDVNLTTGDRTERRPRFADGGRYQTFGAFVQDEVNIVERRLKLVLGGRYSHVEIDGEFSDAAAGTVSLDRTLDRLTGSASLWASPADEIAFLAGIAQGFRAPNFDDLSVFGQVGQGFEVPNPEADPEESLTYEIGTRFRLPGADPLFTGSVFGHWTEYRDLLQRTRGELDGRSFIDEDGDGIQDPNEQFVVQRKNVGRARIFGVEAEARLRLPERWAFGSERWSVFGHFFWTYGMNLEDDEPVRGIPPAQGLAGVRVEWKRGRYWVEGVGQFVRDQDRIAAADLTDPRIPPGGTPGYEVYHFRAGARFALFRAAAPLREGAPEKDYDAEVALAIENLLDRDYRVHGSGVNGPGTNAVLTLGLRF